MKSKDKLDTNNNFITSSIEPLFRIKKKGITSFRFILKMMPSKIRKPTIKYGTASQRTLSILAIFDPDLELTSISLFRK